MWKLAIERPSPGSEEGALVVLWYSACGLSEVMGHYGGSFRVFSSGLQVADTYAPEEPLPVILALRSDLLLAQLGKRQPEPKPRDETAQHFLCRLVDASASPAAEHSPVTSRWRSRAGLCVGTRSYQLHLIVFLTNKGQKPGVKGLVLGETNAKMTRAQYPPISSPLAPTTSPLVTWRSCGSLIFLLGQLTDLQILYKYDHSSGKLKL
ncbi:hypothetical protein H920_01111 [Fukomys damarensis]|uniref:Uncharacterized protein n=1 Tax=Fukomys damarensis TaxID=885580 RepID=A0A091E2C5_FUKDA|nr:hypothetical protein H920_01111 [Fukomys damarensis]